MTGEASSSWGTIIGAIISGFGQVVTWAIIVVGWYFVDRRNNRRETRKETWARICDIIELVNVVIELGAEYHTTESPNAELSKKIKYYLHRIARDLTLVSRKVKIDTKYMRDFRRSITLDNFDSIKFIQYSQYGKEIEEIHVTGDTLSNKLEEAFNMVYPD